jgi:hypothetical protein
MPCARTVQGLTPTLAAINIVSPSPNNIKPMTRYNNVIILGFKFSASKELQESVGTFFKEKIKTSIFI